jgi:chitinase
MTLIRSIIWLPLILPFCAKAQQTHLPSNKAPSVIAYYSGDSASIARIHTDRITHIIYSFGHLNGDTIAIGRSGAEQTLRALAALKKEHPALKVQVALGGWGGCQTCSVVFATETGREDFAKSASRLCERFGIDGIDLDWEYPAIAGFPGHPFQPGDREHFTELLRSLRKHLSRNAEISFAVGAFPRFIDSSVDWHAVEPLVNRINLMSYDLVTEGAPATGHHTPLYSTPRQDLSADRAITQLREMEFPLNKIALGCAFYARSFGPVDDIDHGLSQPGPFKAYIPYRKLVEIRSSDTSIHLYRDTTAKAPWLYSAATRTFYTFDDRVSLEAKTRYVMERGLNGIMFWELSLDTSDGELLGTIYRTIQEARKPQHQ